MILKLLNGLLQSNVISLKPPYLAL